MTEFVNGFLFTLGVAAAIGALCGVVILAVGALAIANGK